MEIKTKTSGDVLIVRLDGNLSLRRDVDPDATEADGLTGVMAKARADGFKNVIFDLKKVPLIDSAGIGALVMYKKRSLEDGGDLKLLQPRGRVKDLLYLVKLDGMFETFEDEGEATASFQ